MTKKFIVQTGNNNTVRVFDAATGSLHRVINVDGNIISQPVISENELAVTVKSGTVKTIKMYNLNNGSLKKSIPLQ